MEAQHHFGDIHSQACLNTGILYVQEINSAFGDLIWHLRSFGPGLRLSETDTQQDI